MKQLSGRMANPTVGDEKNMKRLARYLKGRERVEVQYEYQKNPWELEARVDTDYAGC